MIEIVEKNYNNKAKTTITEDATAKKKHEVQQSISLGSCDLTSSAPNSSENQVLLLAG